MSQQPPNNGELGSSDRPTTISTDVLELLTQAGAVDSLVGLARDSADRQDGTVVYADTAGAPTDLAVWVDGVKRPVTDVEWVDSTGVARPVTEWHLGPPGEFALTLNSLTFVQPATFGVRAIASAGSAQPGGTLDVTADVTNPGDETGTQNITLDIDNGIGQVDGASVTLSGGGSTTQTLSWSVPSNQTEQDYQATVASADDSASTTVTVSSVPPSLVSHWTFDSADTNSGTAVDVVGSNNGTIQGATTGVIGANQTYNTNEAYSFDGTDDSVEIPGTPDFSGQAFTLAVWVRPDNLNNVGNIIGQDKFGGIPRNQRIMTNNGTIETRVYNGSSDRAAVIPSSKVSAGNWYHIAGVFNHATAETKIYLNGSLEDTTSANSAKETLTDIQIGKSDSELHDRPSYYTGRVDDARLYSKELTSTEVSNLYNNGRI